jgi:excisionase family DNA binding protein
MTDIHLTVTEAAARLGVSVRTVRRACADGTIPCTRLGPRTWSIPASSLPAVIRRRAPHGCGLRRRQRPDARSD